MPALLDLEAVVAVPYAKKTNTADVLPLILRLV